MPYVITEPCIDVMDKSCIEACPVDCIYTGDRMLYIHPDECVDCGACEPVCPSDAIGYDVELEGDQERFIDINAEFTRSLGEPGGSANVAPGGDHPVVLQTPPPGP